VHFNCNVDLIKTKLLNSFFIQNGWIEHWTNGSRRFQPQTTSAPTISAPSHISTKRHFPSTYYIGPTHCRFQPQVFNLLVVNSWITQPKNKLLVIPVGPISLGRYDEGLIWSGAEIVVPRTNHVCITPDKISDSVCYKRHRCGSKDWSFSSPANHPLSRPSVCRVYIDKYIARRCRRPSLRFPSTTLLP